MIYVTFVLAVTTVLFLATAGLAVHRQQEAEKARDEALEVAREAEGRLRSAKGAIAPLTWTWNLLESKPLPTGGDVLKLRHYLVAAFRSMQDAADLDDLDMAAAMEDLADPPRRLPKYPQVPTYLASPEDVMGIDR